MKTPARVPHNAANGPIIERAPTDRMTTSGGARRVRGVLTRRARISFNQRVLRALRGGRLRIRHKRESSGLLALNLLYGLLQTNKPLGRRGMR